MAVDTSPDRPKPIARSLPALHRPPRRRRFPVAYRLAPEFAFPAAVRDGIDAYRQLLQRGVKPTSLVLAGDGSGGGLAFAVTLAVRNANLPVPAGIVAMSPLGRPFSIRLVGAAECEERFARSIGN